MEMPQSWELTVEAGEHEVIAPTAFDTAKGRVTTLTVPDGKTPRTRYQLVKATVADDGKSAVLKYERLNG